MATQASCAFGAARAFESTRGYIILLAVVFTPVVFVCSHAGRRLTDSVVETVGWLLLLLFWIVAAGNL